MSLVPKMVRELVDRRLEALTDFTVFLDELSPAADFGGTPAVKAIVRQWAAEHDGQADASDHLHVGFAIGIELGRRLGGAR